MQAQQFNNGGQLSPRATFLQKFTSQDKRTETQTSILQALFMMNGKFLAERTKLENNKSLATIATASPFTGRRIETMYAVALSGLPQIPAVAWMADQGFLAQRRIETLYLLVLSRPPRPEEMASRVRYIDETAQRVRNLDASGARGERVEAARRQALSDVYWALLNSGEFMLNH